MNLLFFIDGMNGGGAQRVMAAVLNHYARKGYDVTLAMASPDKPVFELDKKIRLVHLIDDYPNSTGTFYTIRRYFILRKRIRHCAREIRPDVVVSFIIMFNYKVILALLGTGLPVIVCEHSNVTRKYPLKNILLRRLLYPFSKAITVLTRRDLMLWRKKYRQAVYLPNPCDVITVSDVHCREKVILSAGNVCSWKIKGFDNLIKCWERLREDFPDWKLQISGKFDEASLSYLSSLSGDFENSRIEFLGFRNDVGTLMDKAGIYCLSSRIEGLPMALLEAMGHSCCCVAFDCQTGPSEIIKDGFDGLLVEDDNINDMEAKLRILMSNDDLRKKYASRAPMALGRYSFERVFNRWDILLAKVSEKNADR